MPCQLGVGQPPSCGSLRHGRVEEHQAARALARRGAAAAKVIGRLPGETSYLSSTGDVLDLVIIHSNGVIFTGRDRQATDRLGRERAEWSTGEEVVVA